MHKMQVYASTKLTLTHLLVQLLGSLKKLDAMQQTIPVIRILYFTNLFVCSNKLITLITLSITSLQNQIIFFLFEKIFS
ncbi:hypothetical protein ICU_04743 [Bacillus cereus BAG2X1-1]|nr:hypothetical protein ICU_04743 [Bacillus cereus BAG2X1-1]